MPRAIRAVRHGKGAHVEEEVFWRADGTAFPAEYWSYPVWRGDEIIGGVVTRLGSTVYDGSVTTQLEKMKQVLVEAGQ